ncbi:MAG TPA: four helix bundle protein [Rhizomicrobium sp.]
MAEQINSYRDLRVWQDAMTLAENCYVLTKDFPREEMFGLTSQIRRAATSIPANIAEGYGRENSGSYIQFLRIAQGSLKELESHLIISQRVNLAASPLIDPMLELCGSLGRMLRALIKSIEGKKW